TRSPRQRVRAMRAWIDSTNDGLSGMPADGISLPPKKGTSARPAGAARRLDYIKHTRLGGRADRLWARVNSRQCSTSVIFGAKRIFPNRLVLGAAVDCHGRD